MCEDRALLCSGFAETDRSDLSEGKPRVAKRRANLPRGAHGARYLGRMAPQVKPVRAAAPIVMAGLGPAIHVLAAGPKTWMRGTSPRMTVITASQRNG